MKTNKTVVNRLIEISRQKGISRVVISPGSRNAPLIIGFDEDLHFKCYAIPDERVAAFFALGMAQQLQEPVILTCTSGSAGLNYAPAIAEAYYQRIPLLIVTADRPEEWVDQGEGQTIRQFGQYANFINGSYQLPQEPTHPDNIWHADRILSEAIDRCTTGGPAGPVHINVPFREPLYGNATEELQEPRAIQTTPIERTLPSSELDRLAKIWNKAASKLILVGQGEPNADLENVLKRLSNDPSVAVFTETTSNVSGPRFFPCIDKLIDPLPEDQLDDFQPELLITLGGAIVSKKIKAFLRKWRGGNHWHLDPYQLHFDTFQRLTETVPMPGCEFLKLLYPFTRSGKPGYFARWDERHKRSEAQHKSYFETIPYSDLQVFHTLLNALPEDTDLHLGNSTPVRYAQLIVPKKSFVYHCNRGTSGIDGCTSTAAGAAVVQDEPVVLITGDVGFFYDSNALWNPHLTSNLRIILINNGGGGIFRIIPGPDTTGQLQQFFETGHDLRAKGIAETFGLNYFQSDTLESLEKQLPEFLDFEQDRPALLEILTPRESNSEVLRAYFRHLRD